MKSRPQAAGAAVENAMEGDWNGANPNRATPLVSISCALSALILYTATLAPGIPSTDGGELILAAWSLGIAHPPGFPLWLICGWLFSHLLPFGSVAWRLNWMSAFWGASAVAVIACAIWHLLRSRHSLITVSGVASSTHTRRDSRDQMKSRGPAPKEGPAATLPRQHSIALIAALSAGLCLAAGRTLWSWSVVTEVYSLHAFLAAFIVALLFRWRALLARNKMSEAAAYGALLPASLLYGLALGNHSITVAALAPAILYWLYANRQAVNARIFSCCALALAAGMMVYAYLPLRAATHPLLNWGDPSDPTRFWWHVSGKQYQVNILSGSWENSGQQLWMVLVLLWHQFGPWNLPVLAIGLVALMRQNRQAGIFSVMIAVVTAGYALAYDIADDRDAYYLNVFLMAAIWLGCGFWYLMHWLMSRTRFQASAIRNAILLLPVITVFWNWAAADHRHYSYASDYARNALAEAAQGAVIITADWQLYAPLLTLLHVEKQRPDVAALDVLMFQNRSWYQEHLRRAYPSLIDKAVEPAAAFLDQLQQFEAGRLSPDGWEIGQRYHDYWVALLTDWLARRPVYITPDALAHLRQFGITLDPQLAPGGVMFRILREPVGPATRLDALSWNIRAFLDANRNGWLLDEPARKIRRAHAIMALNRGLYLQRHQAGKGAREMFELSSRIDPEYEDVRKVLGGN